MIKRNFAILTIILIASLKFETGAGAQSKEALMALTQDGLGFTSFSGTRTDGKLTLYASKSWKPSDDLYFFPPNIRIERRDSQYNYWHIPPGGHSSMSTWKYNSGGNNTTFIRNQDGSYTYKNWNGTSYANNGKNFGDWMGDGYRFYSLAWIVPENIEVIRYSSNADSKGRWQFKAPVLNFVGRNMNNFTYSVTYRVRESAILEANTLP